MSTVRTFANMLNQKPASKTPAKDTKQQKESPWVKMSKKKES